MKKKQYLTLTLKEEKIGGTIAVSSDYILRDYGKLVAIKELNRILQELLVIDEDEAN